ncbi:MAG: NAD(P)H-dependent oxidoreductase [Bacillota bacterium]|nr:NAD(P)H-dependent oxidoreductase [Bacillota bacterium]
MKKLLVVDACINRKTSRTERLANALVDLLLPLGYQETRIILEEENIGHLDSKRFSERDGLIRKGDYSHRFFKYAKQLQEADLVVIAAPYWDFSYPTLLKEWIEAISAMGICYNYDERGASHGLARGEVLFYVTTAGGDITGLDFGYLEIEALCQRIGIKKVVEVLIQNIDIVGNDPEKMLQEKIASLPELVKATITL